MGPSKPVDLRQHLKRATRAQHERLDGYLGSAAKFETRQQYLLFLWAMIDTHRKFGLPAARQRNSDGDLALELQRISALEKDLALPITYDSAPSAELIWTPQADDYTAFSWGVGYVLNGSALGACVMLKHNFLHPEWPRSYFTLGQNYARSGRLSNYFASLDRKKLDAKSAVSGAQETFSHLETILLTTVKTSLKGKIHADFT